MNWKINGVLYSGRIVEVGVEKEFTDFINIQATYPNEDLLILVYGGTYNVNESMITPDAYNKYIKAVEEGVIFNYQMNRSAFDTTVSRDFVVEGITLTGFFGCNIDSYKTGYQKFVYSKCNVLPQYRGFLILGVNGTFLVRYCNIGNGKAIAECQSSGDGTGVSIHKCIGASLGFGSWEEQDFSVSEAEGYGINYGENYIEEQEVLVSTLAGTNITQSNFVANGSIEAIDEGITVIKRGFCYKVKE